MAKSFVKLKTLVAMQLKDKMDLSFIRSPRSAIIKTVLSLLKLIVATLLFWLLFFVCNILSVFYPVGFIPDKAVNVLFTLIQLMSIIVCSVGLTRALYMTSDNRVLLTFPVGASSVYSSKLILYYIFELRKNLSLTLPLFIAYGIINGAVWYFYPWLLFCFVFVSLVPVAIGAVLSIPLLFIWQFIKRINWLKALLALIVASAVVFAIVRTIMLIPSNINIMGQWYAITLKIQAFLDKFAKIFLPFYYMTLMIVGGTLRMGTAPINGDTFIYFAVLLACSAVLLALSFIIVRPLFISMASKQFEYEKKKIPPRKNRARPSLLAPFSESLKIELKSSGAIFYYVVQLAFPAVATLFLNKLYGAMNTNYSGLIMTKTFNLLVMLVMTLSFNNAYASVYSKEAAARNIIKTRPQKPIYTLISRISVRAVVIALSSISVMAVYLVSSGAEDSEIVLMALITLIVSEAHLLWCAELDIMNNYAEQYQTLGVFDSPNERNATIIGFLLAALFTVLYYFLSDRGTLSSLVKCLFAALVFAAARIYLFIIRTKLYFVEK